MTVSAIAIGTLRRHGARDHGQPRPATISLTAAGSALGLRRSLAYLAGIIAGTTASCSWRSRRGSRRRCSRSPPCAPFCSRPVPPTSCGSPTTSRPRRRSPPMAAGRTRRRSPAGRCSGIANPKAWIAIAAVFASARLADGAAVDAAAKVAVLAVMIVAINTTWLAAGASLAPLLRDARRARFVNGGLAGVLVAAAALTVIRP